MIHSFESFFYSIMNHFDRNARSDRSVPKALHYLCSKIIINDARHENQFSLPTSHLPWLLFSPPQEPTPNRPRSGGTGAAFSVTMQRTAAAAATAAKYPRPGPDSHNNSYYRIVTHRISHLHRLESHGKLAAVYCSLACARKRREES